MFPSIFGLQSIPHYHGDTVRQLFLVSAIILLVASPMVGNLMPFNPLSTIAYAILLIIFAGLTNPRSTIILVIDIIASGGGAFFMQVAAIDNYGVESMVMFILREVLVLFLLYAMYAAIKTSRAMMTNDLGAYNKVGKKD